MALWTGLLSPRGTPQPSNEGPTPSRRLPWLLNRAATWFQRYDVKPRTKKPRWGIAATSKNGL